MEIILLIVAVVAGIVILAVSPLARRHGDTTDMEVRKATGVDVNKQFKRPPREGDLL
jgi:hypothetical protein